MYSATNNSIFSILETLHFSIDVKVQIVCICRVVIAFAAITWSWLQSSASSIMQVTLLTLPVQIYYVDRSKLIVKQELLEYL